MAIIFAAELRPNKTELLDGWAPAQPWFAGESGLPLTSVASYRFDDPEGEVGVEILLVRAGTGPILQVPLTYRSEPLEGAQAWLVGTMEHSVLGKRWVYDGVGDPVYLLTAATAALCGESQAELIVHTDGGTTLREPSALVEGRKVPNAPVPELPLVTDLTVRNESSATVVETGAMQLVVARHLGNSSLPSPDASAGLISGTWQGQPESDVLVTVTRKAIA